MKGSLISNCYVWCLVTHWSKTCVDLIYWVSVRGKENKTKNTTQFLVDTTIHKTQDEDKQNKKTTKYALTTNLHKTKTIKAKTQHNMCLTTLNLVWCVYFVDRCLSFCTFSFVHGIVYSSIYGFWFLLWYLQTLPVPFKTVICKSITLVLTFHLTCYL
jgi:hypothetical protein